MSNRPRRWEIPTSMEQSCWFFPTSFNHHRRSGLVVHPVFPGSSSLAAHTQPTLAMLVLFAMGRLLALRRHRGLQLLVASLHHRVLAPNINCPHIMSFSLAPTNQPTMLVRYLSVTAVVRYQAGRDGGCIFPGRRSLSPMSVIIAVFAFVLKPRLCHSDGCSGPPAWPAHGADISIFATMAGPNLGPPNWLPPPRWCIKRPYSPRAMHIIAIAIAYYR